MKRDLDWDLLALKIAILEPDLYISAQSWDNAPYKNMHPDRDIPAWVPEYVAVQKKLGIHPLNCLEGDALSLAMRRLGGNL